MGGTMPPRPTPSSGMCSSACWYSRFTTGPSEPSPHAYATPWLSITSESSSMSSLSITVTPLRMVKEPVVASSAPGGASSSVFARERPASFSAAFATRSASFQRPRKACLALVHVSVTSPFSLRQPASSRAALRGLSVATIVMPLFLLSAPRKPDAGCTRASFFAAHCCRSASKTSVSSLRLRKMGSRLWRSSRTSPWSVAHASTASSPRADDEAAA
mmetsp:Transcript_5176/g.18086  ORF Transcript_5176/g.18086 Transcript_5176/m.18086 type:complete len:217 (+) Transcript_5176:1215-1865(+)